jgi:hypothetical protein
MVFCLFWGRSVTKAILQSRDQVLSALKDKHEASSTQGVLYGFSALDLLSTTLVCESLLPTSLLQVSSACGSTLQKCFAWRRA